LFVRTTPVNRGYSTQSSIESINWRELKKDFKPYRQKLKETVTSVLQPIASERKSLDLLNPIGIYHFDKKHYKDKKDQYLKEKQKGTVRVPESWVTIYSEYGAGMWCNLFDPHNSYNINIVTNTTETPLPYMKILFKPDYYLWDPKSEVHVELWKKWLTENYNKKPNPWSNIKTYGQFSMEQNASNPIVCKSFPFHHSFYKENRFAAVIGYSDYTSLIVLDPDSIKEVEFLQLEAIEGGSFLDTFKPDVDFSSLHPDKWTKNKSQTSV